MNDRDEQQLVGLIQRELKNLPDLPAPETLVHRVMLAVHERQRQSWWQQPWLAWPFIAQLVSLAVLVMSAGLVSYLLGAAWDGLNVTSISGRLTGWASTYAPVWESIKTFSAAAPATLRKAGQPLLFLVVGFLLTAYFLCVGLGTVCFRLAWKRA